jgi:hypothetical protein
MLAIENLSRLPHHAFLKTGPNGVLFDVVVVRATFDFARDGKPVSFAQEQTPIVYGDMYLGQTDKASLKGVIRHEGDLSVGKASTDVLLAGFAHALEGKPQAEWLATLKVGPVKKSLQLMGPRQMKPGIINWKFTAPRPVSAVELDYRHVFGGCFAGEGAQEFVYKLDNSAGCGWLPDRGELKRLSEAARKVVEAQISGIKSLPAPQIEIPGKSIKYPYERRDSEGFGPIPPWHRERARYAGTYGEKWQKERLPHEMLPDDFDPRFYQAASPGLICPEYLKGDERVLLSGLTEEGKLEMCLPGAFILARVDYEDGRKQAGPLALDTVEIDLDTRQIVLKWRGLFEREHPVRHLCLSAVVER